MKRFWSRSLAALALALVTVGRVAGAGDFHYFSNPDLDFWRSGASPTNKEVNSSPVPAMPRVPRAAGEIFPWKKYLDPKNDDFFREGNYTPPAPFMEIARDPSDENITNWFRYLEMKNQILARLQTKLTAYAASHPRPLLSLSPEAAAAMSQAAPLIAQAAAHVNPGSAPLPDAKRYRLRLYFDSHCPHCEHMIATTIHELAAMGFWIELRQVDRDERARARIPFSVQPASPEELKRYGIERVPILLVGDLKAHSYFKMQGDQTAQSVLTALQAKNNATQEIRKKRN